MNGYEISVPAMWWDDIPRATIFMLFFTDVVESSGTELRRRRLK